MAGALPPPPSKPRWNALGVTLFILGLLFLIPASVGAALAALPLLSNGFARGDYLTGMILTYSLGCVAFGTFLVYSGLKSRHRS
jgi:hypothetical protein